MKAATIYDVARLAGVSHQTVSRFLSGFEGIRPETRARVEQAVAELGYRPNTAARSLRLQRSTRIGVVADRIDSSGPARVVAGLTGAAQSLGYLVDVVSTVGLTEESAGHALDILQDSQVAGVITIGETTAVNELLAKLLADEGGRRPRVVLAEAALPFNEQAGTVAADHLLELGHRRIGYLAGPESWMAANARLHAFVDRVESRKGSVVGITHGDWSPQSGYDAFALLADAGASAIACGNDGMAVGLIAAAAEAGVEVPRDLSVVGTDDLPEAAYLRPALSTVAVDFEGEGASFVAALLQELGEPADGILPPRAPHVIRRASTAEVRPAG